MLQDKTDLLYIIPADKLKTTPQETSNKRCVGTHWLTMFAVSLSLSLTTVFAVIVITGHLTTATDEPLITPYEKNSVDSPPFYSSKFVERQIWGGKPSLQTKPLQHPVDLVIVAHTVTKFCTTITECSKIVKAVQNYHLHLKMDDIAYNFLIGGDGNIYVGRGWDYVNTQRNQSISVSFIGNFLTDYLNGEMIDALQELLSEGVRLKKLSEDYNIVCHNQTVATLSPGVNVYTILKTWSHFKPGKVGE